MTASTQSDFPAADLARMDRALALAEQGRGCVEPNPMVGAVVVDPSGRVVGEGFHERFGGPHAEANALAAAGSAARGATLYVTLEPCCHHGKTPPCTEAIASAGVAQVVCAMRDPFERVAGQGVAALEQAGIEVKMGCRAEAAAELNIGYLTLINRGRPLVIAKWAQTADGLIAATSIGRWITGDESLNEAHRLRAICQAILVGAGTVLADDPELTTRRAAGRSPHRYVLDGRLRTPPTCKLAASAAQTPTTILTTTAALRDQAARAAELRDAGVELLALADAPSIAWNDVLAELGRRRVTRLLVEGGAEVLRSLLAARAADRVAVFQSPDTGGEGLAIWPGGGLPFDVEVTEQRPLGRDTLTCGRVVYR